MNIFSGIVVFTCIWWTVIFCILPLGMQSEQHEKDDITAPGAPSEDPQLKKKLLLTTAISIVLFLIAYAIIESGIIDWRELAARQYGVTP
ncbi:MAG: DUF1467 family protein [Alphaproteobacteria bacterium]|nr:DUF1467 family protein [Alphaproteobacteria bacterium]MCB1839735.1 DUF1467 family protein [Alphaproteobacteria bacterium]